jgi:biotin carboxyl carrier protein
VGTLGLVGGLAPAGAPGSTDGPLASSGDDLGAPVLVDGEPLVVGLHVRDDGRARLTIGTGATAEVRELLLVEPPDVGGVPGGARRREVVVDGWRIEVDVESERRAVLRERASHGRAATTRGGPTEVHAIIPGRVVSVSVAAGDEVVAGQQLLAVEAMKMQNELRAPRDGRIERVAVAADQTIEVGDLLLVIS